MKYSYFDHQKSKPAPGQVFVFGSNLAGIHGAGAAKTAYEEYGAIWRMGEGFAGSSYAIPTKDQRIKSLPLDYVKLHVETFLEFARNNPDVSFYVTAVGCGLAKNDFPVMAAMFKDAPENCQFDKRWRKHLEKEE